MTTKPKTGKPAAKPATPGEFASLPYDGMTASIPKLSARLRFLEADCVYNAAIAPRFSETHCSGHPPPGRAQRDYAKARQNRAGLFR